MAESLPKTGIYDLDVTVQKQRSFWCGYESIAASLRYWGYRYTQDEVFAQAHDGFDFEKETGEWTKSKSSDAPGLVACARQMITDELEAERAVREELTTAEIAKYRNPDPLIPLKVELFDRKRYAKMTKVDPPKVVELFITQRRTPCIIRTPEHWRIIRGIDFDSDQYIVAEPLRGEIIRVDRYWLNNRWAVGEGKIIGADGRNLMITVTPAVARKQ